MFDAQLTQRHALGGLLADSWICFNKYCQQKYSLEMALRRALSPFHQPAPALVFFFFFFFPSQRVTLCSLSNVHNPYFAAIAAGDNMLDSKPFRVERIWAMRIRNNTNNRGGGNAGKIIFGPLLILSLYKDRVLKLTTSHINEYTCQLSELPAISDQCLPPSPAFSSSHHRHRSPLPSLHFGDWSNQWPRSYRAPTPPQAFQRLLWSLVPQRRAQHVAFAKTTCCPASNWLSLNWC